MRNFEKINRPVTARKLFLENDCQSADIDAVENLFFSSIQLPNGTYKETYNNRLDDINALIIGYLKETGYPCKNILDIGISSGISTKELYDKMINHGLNCAITAVDLTINGYIINICPGIYALVDREANLLQLDLFGNSIGHWYIKGNGIKLYLKKICQKVFDLLFRHSTLKRISTPHSTDPPPIKLLTRKLPKGKGVTYLEHDIFHPFPQNHHNRYHLIRVANILNRAYFTIDEIMQCVRNLSACLADSDAVFCIIRTDNTGKNNGSMLRWDATGNMHKTLAFGDQSEIDSIFFNQ